VPRRRNGDQWGSKIGGVNGQMESARLGGNWTLLFGQKKIFRDEISPTKRYSEKVDGRQDICRWSATRLKSTVLKNCHSPHGVTADPGRAKPEERNM
jgi:hypothetical protein